MPQHNYQRNQQQQHPQQQPRQAYPIYSVDNEDSIGRFCGQALGRGRRRGSSRGGYGNYQGNYKRNYQGNYEGNYQGNYQGNYKENGGFPNGAKVVDVVEVTAIVVLDMAEAGWKRSQRLWSQSWLQSCKDG